MTDYPYLRDGESDVPNNVDPMIGLVSPTATASRGTCSICHRQMPRRRDGAIRVHGPVSGRCPGSGQPPSDDAIVKGVTNNDDNDDIDKGDTCPTADTCFDDSCTRLFVKVLRRIPRSSRDRGARKLAAILTDVTTTNSIAAWTCLICLPRRCFRVPKRGGKRWNLSNLVNQQLIEEADASPISSHAHPSTKRHVDNISKLATSVSIKLEEGDFKGAVRLACSEDTMAEDNEVTIAALRSKHPAPHPDTTPIPPPSVTEFEASLQVNGQDIMKAIRSFPKGSSGGPDGLRPQHLCDLTGPSAGEGGVLLLQALSDFANFVLSGNTPMQVRPFFFGASVIALNKKDGGVRPIAVGCTLRRLVAKLACMSISERMGTMLAPVQLGYGTPNGAEAAVHSARIYLDHLPSDHVMLKIDFKNAFNYVRRDKMLEMVRQCVPEIFPFVYTCYSAPSSLCFHETTLQSAERVQQGDPLGPLLFCLAIQPILLQLKSEFRVFYLDDGTLGGPECSVLEDLKLIQREAGSLGLLLNHSKSELICNDSTGLGLLAYAPDLCEVKPGQATLLGSPIGGLESINITLLEKLNILKVLGSRLVHLHKQDALLLLRNAFAIPKILYVLRTAPCFYSTTLEAFDQELRSILSTVLNVCLDNNSTWTQATLPIASGGIGIRSSIQLAPSAFLASAAGSSTLTYQTLPDRLVNVPYQAKEDALKAWTRATDCDPPTAPDDKKQKAWDSPCIQTALNNLLRTSTDDNARARLSAATSKEAGAWMNALPITSVGLRMEDDVIRIAAGLRLGAPLCHPHSCRLCGRAVDTFATHGLSCTKSAGRHFRHAAINNIIHRSLSSAKIPSSLEPPGLSRSDGKRPDGITITPWKAGRTLIWDATCCDTFAASNVGLASKEAGSAAEVAERQKKTSNSSLKTRGAAAPRTRITWRLC